MCTYLNFMFGDVRNVKTATVISRRVTLQVMKPVAQTLTQGLTTASGCCFLYTHELGIAFEFERLDECGRIVIRTSPLLCCENQRGCVSGLLALSHCSVQKITKDKDFRLKVQEFADNIYKEVSKRTAFDGNLDGSHASSDGTPGVRGSGQEVRSQKRRRTAGGGPQAETMSEASFANLITEAENDETTLKDIVAIGKTILARGASGFAVESMWQGRRTVTKLWNGEDEEGLVALCREIEVYKYLQEKCPSEVGCCVPAILLGLNKRKEDTSYGGSVALVEEYIGNEVKRGRIGNLFVIDDHNSLQVPSREERGIYKAAMESLTALHKHGVMHGDIALRNLRVEKQRYGNGRSKWRAWWIDFGLSEVGHGKHSLSLLQERNECASLFRLETSQYEP